jgi:hypothetical protein
LEERAQELLALVAVEPREAVLGTRVAPVGESGSCSFNSRQRGAGRHTAAYYAAGNMPTQQERYTAVAAETTPDLYGGILEQLISPTHLKASKWNVQQVDAIQPGDAAQAEVVETVCHHMNNRAAGVRRNVVELCELVASGQAGGSCLSPACVENGVLLALCGATKRGVGLFSGKNICVSWPTAQSIIGELLHLKKVDLLERMAACKSKDNACVLMMVDNYVQNQSANSW